MYLLFPSSSGGLLPVAQHRPAFQVMAPGLQILCFRIFRWFSTHDSITPLLSSMARWRRHGSDWHVEEATFCGQLLCPLPMGTGHRIPENRAEEWSAQEKEDELRPAYA